MILVNSRCTGRIKKIVEVGFGVEYFPAFNSICFNLSKRFTNVTHIFARYLSLTL
jgi:hypothetical protein